MLGAFGPGGSTVNGEVRNNFGRRAADVVSDSCCRTQ